MPLLLDEWEGYEAATLPANASLVQIQETRRAFFAGAHALMRVQIKITEAGPPSDGGLNAMRSIAAELKAFWEMVEDGEA